MRVYFTNLGCKLNQAEIDQLTRRFLAAGHRLATDLSEAELHVVNSCHVTHLAARDSRKIARRGSRLVPGMKTVLTGCYATGDPAEAASLSGVDLVVPNARKHELLDLVHSTFPETVPPPPLEEGPLPVPYVPLETGHARALVKVEDGCNMRCSFCIIPSLRGKQRSRPVSEVVEEVSALDQGGFREVVVTGVQISEYAHGEDRLYDLVRALLQQTQVPRLRLTSIAPWRFDRRLLTLWSDPRLCRHLHMSLQSGCTRTLRRMRRPYTAEQYAQLVGSVREAIPGVAVTTDVIVGFPGESEEEFAESLAFVEAMEFTRPHVFSFSPRQGTAAAELPDPVAPPDKKRRVAAMLEVARASEARFRQAQIGSDAVVVWEERRSDGLWTGLTDHYVRVFADSTEDLQGGMSRVLLQEEHGGGLRAQIQDHLRLVAPRLAWLPERGSQGGLRVLG